MICGEPYTDAPWALCYVDRDDHGLRHQAFTHYPAQVVTWPVETD